MSHVWLVTGSGSGLGLSITRAALDAGHRVMATARDTAPLEVLRAEYGDRIQTFPLDVTVESQARAAVQATVDTFGRLDVVVNNAGYGDMRAFEQVPSADFQRLIDTCFSGVVYLTRAALPVMRQQRRGHVIQVSSLGGRTAWPGNAAYHAAKWAVGGFTESVALEVAPFGVTVVALEPGAMRTNWGARAHAQFDTPLPDYDASVGATARQLAAYWGHETGDPRKVAALLLQLVECDRLPPHLLLGSDAVQLATQADATRAAQAAQWRDISTWIDMTSDGPLPALPTA